MGKNNHLVEIGAESGHSGPKWPELETQANMVMLHIIWFGKIRKVDWCSIFAKIMLNWMFGQGGVIGAQIDPSFKHEQT